MSLTPEEIKEAKQQLFEQIKNLPPEKKAEAEKQINNLSIDAIESMLEQQSNAPQIFRQILEGKIPSVKIGENSGAVAVLSTKSISKGHTIIIPKNPILDEKLLPPDVHSLSEETSKKIIDSLKCKSTSILSEKAFGEVIINIIPIYDKHLDLKSPREDNSLEKLEEIKRQIDIQKISTAPQKIKIEKPKKEKIVKLKRRIP